jgi:LppP/LprE lipoprotein
MGIATSQSAGMATQRPVSLAGLLAAGLACAALVGGCGGSSTKTVSVASSPAETETATSSTTRARSTSSTTTTGSTTTGAASSATRTASAPAFTHQGGSEATPQGATATAAAVVRAHGYTPSDTSQYHPDQTLAVLVGTRTGSADGYQQQAFFFLDGRYIGTDTSQPSATIKVISQGDTEVTLAYPLYHAHDPLCCPSGGSATVNFQLNNGRLTPLQSIPPAASQAGLSRQ